MTTFQRCQQQATELVSKWISKKVTKVFITVEHFYGKFFCIPVLLKNVVHKGILIAAFV